MMQSRRLLLLCAVFCCVFFRDVAAGAERQAEETVFLPVNTVVYPSADCNLKSGFTRVLKTPAVGFSLDKRKCRFDLGVFSYCFTLHKIITEYDKQIFWASPELQIDPRTNNPVLAPNVIGIILAGIFLIVAVVCFYLISRFEGTKVPGKLKTILLACLPVFSIIFLHWGVSLYCASATSVRIAPVDELKYFEVSKLLLSGAVTGPQYYYTIGWPLVMALFVLLQKASSFLQIEQNLIILNSFVVMPAFMVLCYFVLKKFSTSNRALFAVILYRIATFFLQYQDFFDDKSGNFIAAVSFFGTSTGKLCYQTYNTLIQLSYSALSDAVPCFLLALMVLIILYLPPKIHWVLLVSVLMGFSCLVRINSIIFAPLLLSLFLLHHRKSLPPVKSCVLYGIAGGFCFSLIFGWQLLLNKLQFGNVWIFPYALHTHDPDCTSGFLWKFYIRNSRYIFTTLYPYFMCGMFFLVLTSRRVLRALFSLWIIPLTFFYSGYSGVGVSVGRFLLPVFPVLVAACVMSDCWGKFHSVRFRTVLAACVLLQVIFTTPSNYSLSAFGHFFLQNQPFGQTIVFVVNLAIPVVLLFVTLLLLRRSWRELGMCWAFILSYASGFIWLIPSAMFFVLCRTGYDLFAAALTVKYPFRNRVPNTNRESRK